LKHEKATVMPDNFTAKKKGKGGWDIRIIHHAGIKKTERKIKSK